MTVTVPREVDAKYLSCYIQPRYWEDSEFDKQADDEKGSLVRKLLPESIMTSEEMMEFGLPERYSHGFIRLDIDLDNGTVKGWPKGNTASFGYKSCDCNIFVLMTGEGNVIHQTREGDTEYVIGPKFMNDCGDYFVLQVEEDGSIVDWDEYKMEQVLTIWVNDSEE